MWLRLNSTTRARPDPRVPTRTRTDFFARPGPQTRDSDKVRGLCLVGSGRARVVGFSYWLAERTARTRGVWRRTVDAESQSVSRSVLNEDHLESSRASERLLHHAHYVDARALRQLRLLPDGRVVEHAVVLHVKVAVEYHLATGSDVILLARGHHQHARAPAAYAHTLCVESSCQYRKSFRLCACGTIK